MSLFDDLMASLNGISPDAMASLTNPQRQVVNANGMGTALSVGGGVLSGIGSIMGGREAQVAAQFTAAQLRQNAGQAEAQGERAAFDVSRQSKLIASRALAVAAASGGGASDPTVVNLIAQNAEEGAYRQQVALYNGQDRARSMRLAADVKETEGDQAETAGVLGGITKFVSAGANLMQGTAKGASMFQRFAGNGPNLPGGMG